MEVLAGGGASCTAVLQGTAAREARVLMHTLPSLILDFTRDNYASKGQTLVLDFTEDVYGYGVMPPELWALPPTPCVATSSLTGSGHLWIDTEADPARAVGLVASADTFCERNTSGQVSAEGSGLADAVRTVNPAGSVLGVASGTGKARNLAAGFGTSSGVLTGTATCHRNAVVAKAKPPSLSLNFATEAFKVEDGTANPWAEDLIPAVGSASAQASCEKTTEAYSFDATTDPATLDLDFTSNTYSLIDRSWLAATAVAQADTFVDNISEGHCTAEATGVGSAQVSFAGQGACTPTLNFAPVTAFRIIRMRRHISRGIATVDGEGHIYVLAAGHVEARAHVFGTWREVARGTAVATGTATGTAGSRIRQAKGNTVADPNEPSLSLDFTQDTYDVTHSLLSGTGALVEGGASIEAKGEGWVFATIHGNGAVRYFDSSTGLNHVDAFGQCSAHSSVVNTEIRIRIVSVARCVSNVIGDPQFTFAGRGKSVCKAQQSGYAERVIKAEGSGKVSGIVESTSLAKTEAFGAGDVSAAVIPTDSARLLAKGTASVTGTAEVVSGGTCIGIKAQVLGGAIGFAKAHRDAQSTAVTTGSAVVHPTRPTCFLNTAGGVTGAYSAKAECSGGVVLVEKIPISGSVVCIASVAGINNVNIDLVAPVARVAYIEGLPRYTRLDFDERIIKVA